MADRETSDKSRLRSAAVAAWAFLALANLAHAKSAGPLSGPSDQAARQAIDPLAEPTLNKPDYAASTRPDQIGRVIVPVMVNQKGPFKFALDTGANCTVLTPRLVAALSLPGGQDAVTMNGATGSAEVPTALVQRVSAGDLALQDQQLPVAEALISEVDGILGVDSLASKRVMVDFTNHRIEIRNSDRERPIGWARRISAEMRLGGLIVVDAYVDRIPVKAVIDTGSQYTLGNEALQAALAVRTRAAAPYAAVYVLGETSARQLGERQAVQTVTIGDLKASNLRVTFGDFNVFKLWELGNRPAVVIGMDLLSRLDALVIDYGRREVQLRTTDRHHDIASLVR